jgi:hypothetical protein
MPTRSRWFPGSARRSGRNAHNRPMSYSCSEPPAPSRPWPRRSVPSARPIDCNQRTIQQEMRSGIPGFDVRLQGCQVSRAAPVGSSWFELGLLSNSTHGR